MCVTTCDSFCFQVNPAENHVDINEGKWEQKDGSLASQRAAVRPAPEHQTSGDSATLAADAPQDLRANPCTRKSSKAKRVKNYLKKCKNAALGNSSSTTHSDEQEHAADSAADQEKQEVSRLLISRRRSNSGNRDISSTSWYVPPDLEPSPNLVSVVEVLPPGQTNETRSENANSAVIETVSDSACSVSHASQNDPGDVLDSRNEGGTTVITLESQDESTPSGCVVESSPSDEPRSLYLPPRDNPADTVHNTPEASEVST
jgi:hypothetical protein